MIWSDSVVMREPELDVDVTFQQGPFHLVIKTYKKPLFSIKGTDHSPCFVSLTMIFTTKEEPIYLSLIQCLLRALPWLGKFLHATGTDNKTALCNAVSVGFTGHTHRSVINTARKMLKRRQGS